MKRILFILYILLSLWDIISGGKLVTLAFIVMFIWCCVKIFQTNPGPIPNECPKSGPEILRNICKGCGSWKPPKARHCKHSCNKCIFLYDHHCFWLDKCIGYKNLKYFCQFLFYLYLQSLFSTIQHLITFYQYFEFHEMINFIDKINISNKLKLSFIEIIYIFIYATALRTTYHLLLDKINHILDRNTYIDQLQTQFSFYQTQKKNFYKQFGHNILKWFLPLENELDYNYLECLYPVWTNDEKCIDSNLKDYIQYKVM